MHTTGSVTQWIRDAKAGRADAATQLWHRYYDPLIKLGRKQLGAHVRRAADEEDVVLSAMNSFFEGAQKGKFPELVNRDDLWPLLAKITVRKAIDQIHHDRRQKRGEGKVRGESALDELSQSPGERGIEQVADGAATPEIAMAMAEHCQTLLESLGDEVLREVAEMKLDGYKNRETAEQLRCSERTVERKLWVIRSRWSQHDSHDD